MYMYINEIIEYLVVAQMFHHTDVSFSMAIIFVMPMTMFGYQVIHSHHHLSGRIDCYWKFFLDLLSSNLW